jgi:hypothetical protein
MTDSDLKRYNTTFARELGRHPNGRDPLYKWARTRDLFYLIESPVDTLTPAGLYVRTSGYSKVTWDQRIGPGWVVAAWRSPGSEAQWKATYGSALPYPPEGMYFPIPNSHIPCEPTEEITQEAIAKIREPLDKGYEQILRECKEAADAADAKQTADIQDEIDSDWPYKHGSMDISKPYPKDKEINLQ